MRSHDVTKMRVLVIGVLSILAVQLSGQTPGPTGSADPQPAGARLFRTYCASCHGIAARGDGPAAETFRKPIPDLTKFTAQNGGVFPGERLTHIIDGRGIAAHGTREMPVWGDAFRTERGLTEAAIKERIDAIVGYLRAIQQRPV